MRGDHAAQLCEACRTWQGFLCEVMEDSATLLVQKAAFVEVARLHCEHGPEDGSWIALGCCLTLTAVSAGALFLGEQRCSQLLT